MGLTETKVQVNDNINEFPWMPVAFPQSSFILDF